MSKIETVRTIVSDFLFEPLSDMRSVLERLFPNDPIEITGEPVNLIVTVGDVAYQIHGHTLN